MFLILSVNERDYRKSQLPALGVMLSETAHLEINKHNFTLHYDNRNRLFQSMFSKKVWVLYSLLRKLIF